MSIPRLPSPRDYKFASAEAQKGSLPTEANRKCLPPYIPGMTSWKELGGARGKYKDYVEKIFRSLHQDSDKMLFHAIAPIAGISNDTSQALSRRVEKLKLSSAGTSIDLESDGWWASHTSAIRLDSLRPFMMNSCKVDEYRRYLPLRKHRELVVNLTAKQHFIGELNAESDQAPFDEATTKLEQDLNALIRDFQSDSHSICYPNLDGQISLCLPIKVPGHFFTLVVSRETKDRSTIRIFNKGRQPTKNPFLRDIANVIIPSEKGTYSFSEVEVRNVDNRAFLEPSFLKDLLLHACKGLSVDDFYTQLHERIIVRGRGKVHITEAEREIARRSHNRLWDLDTREAEFQELHKNAPHMHKRMYQGYCYDMNLSTPERLFVSLADRRKEKLHRCNLSIKALSGKAILSKKLRVVHELLLQRIANLKKKLLAAASKAKASAAASEDASAVPPVAARKKHTLASWTSEDVRKRIIGNAHSPMRTVTEGIKTMTISRRFMGKQKPKSISPLITPRGVKLKLS